MPDEPAPNQPAPKDATLVDSVLERMPRFAGIPRRVTALTGGLTNLNVRVTTATDDVVVRISSENSALLAVDRTNEEHNSRLAAASGVAPPVGERLVDPPTLVVDYLPADTMSAALLRRGDRLDRIAATLRTLHGGPPFLTRFDMFQIQPRYLQIVHSMGLVLPERYLDHAPVLERIAEAFSRNPEPLVPCHNDLLAENILDDGQRIWLIDFEYSGNNEASFELGNLAAESALSDAHLGDLVAAYWGEPRPDKEARALLWGLVARYGWTLWGVISEAINALDFDFRGWAMEKYDEFEAVIASPRLEHLLQTCAV